LLASNNHPPRRTSATNNQPSTPRWPLSFSPPHRLLPLEGTLGPARFRRCRCMLVFPWPGRRWGGCGWEGRGCVDGVLRVRTCKTSWKSRSSASKALPSRPISSNPSFLSACMQQNCERHRPWFPFAPPSSTSSHSPRRQDGERRRWGGELRVVWPLRFSKWGCRCGESCARGSDNGTTPFTTVL
jgi:hypothetical protein